MATNKAIAEVYLRDPHFRERVQQFTATPISIYELMYLYMESRSLISDTLLKNAKRNSIKYYAWYTSEISN